MRVSLNHFTHSINISSNNRRGRFNVKIEKAFELVAELIEKRENDLKTADRDKFDDSELNCNPIEADDAMKDKTLRDKLKTIELFIIDEVSMILNVTFMFINLRLCEIFDTTNKNDGFFGRKHHKYLDIMGGSDLWSLFDYDKLLINMQQKCDNTYLDILSKIRIDLVTDSNINVLQVIAIKIGAKVMIRRNINVTLGLVNGTIGNVVPVNGNHIDSIKIVISDNKETTITKVDIKFEVFHKMVVLRKQFPLSLNYGITIHKSQGIMCKNAMMDLGTSVFSDDQAYVGLSVKTNSGAIVEYNLRSVFKAQLPQIHSEKKAVKIHHITSCSNAKCQAKHNTLLHMPSAADPSTNNIDKEVASKEIPPSSVVATHVSGSFNSEQVMLSTAIVLAGRAELCWIADRKRTSYPRNLWKSSYNRDSTRTPRLCIVTDQVTDKIPAVSSGRDKFDLPRNIRLADPRFHISSDIDLLIGAELFWNLICVSQIRSSEHPTLQKTRLGWILAGRLGSTIPTASRVHSFHASVTNAELHEHVSRAWQMDDISARSDNYTMEESICERHFLDNVSQNFQGRYTDALLVRPTVQRNLISILMRFRFFAYVIIADIIKMYRQILVHPSQTRLQRILWRDDLSANVDTYELTTVIYDIASVKWVSNCSELLEIDNRDHVPVIIRDNAADSWILGMQWNQCQDTFQFLCKLETEVHVVAKPNQSEALMGSLPTNRISVSRSFSRCGVDSAGPLLLREGKHRKARSHKSGRPTHMYSDNGTTFVGAHKQIQELYDIHNDQ
ncbi:PIF1 helicase, partial [Acromyrmex charruanus]